MNPPDNELLLSDYEALAAGKGFVNLEGWSTITMTGEDRHTFLHNMCSNDIKRLSPGDCCEAFCTDVKGKIVGHVWVIAQEGRLDLLTVPGQAQGLIAHLDRYIIREDVTLADSTNDSVWFFINNRSAIPSAVAIDSFGSPASLLFTSCGERTDAEQMFASTGMSQCSYQAWNVLRMEAGLPLFGVDFDSTHLPQEVNRDERAISFNKGCYLGQETIARIDALGHVNQQVVAVQFDGEAIPEVGTELAANEKLVGQVTSSCWSPKLQAPLALAMVRRGSNSSGTVLESQAGRATVIDLHKRD